MRNLTELEIAVLETRHNLADGHAYRPWSAAEALVVDSAAEIFRGSDRRIQRKIEQEYLAAFFGLARQTLDWQAAEYFFCFTASSAIEAIANYLRLGARSVALVEPCFDNLSDILRRHGLTISRLEERLFDTPSYLAEQLATTKPDAVFVVSPNNPTGRRLSRAELSIVIEHCARNNATLILDACFRFYLEPHEVYDQYAMLIDAGIEWIIIEDTGKTWPTAEIKAPFFCASPRTAHTLAHIYSDFLLHASPFALRLMTRFIKASHTDQLSSVIEPMRRNRATLDRCLAGTFFLDAGQGPISVAWLRIAAPITATDLTKALARDGIHVLPGDRFFWEDAKLGAQYVRVALARDPEHFSEAAEQLGHFCRSDVAQHQPV